MIKVRLHNTDVTHTYVAPLLVAIFTNRGNAGIASLLKYERFSRQVLEIYSKTLTVVQATSWPSEMPHTDLRTHSDGGRPALAKLIRRTMPVHDVVAQ